MEHWGNNIERGNRSTRRKTYLSVTLSTTNLTRAGPESSVCLPGERLEININLHYSVCSARWTLDASITKINRWILCREIMVVYCNAIFPQLVCSKIIYHLRIIATLCVRWSCSFFVTCPCPADCWQMRHPSKESPAFAHLSYGRYFLLSHYTFISDKQHTKKRCVYACTQSVSFDTSSDQVHKQWESDLNDQAKIWQVYGVRIFAKYSSRGNSTTVD